MTGSVMGPVHKGLVAGFRPQVMVLTGNPEAVVFAPSGTFAKDFTNDAMYLNVTPVSTTNEAGSTWITIGSIA